MTPGREPGETRQVARTESVGRVGFGFTDRLGGVSAAPYDSLNLGGKVGDDALAVAQNRRLVATALGVPPERLVLMAQTHSRDVAVVTERPAVTPVVDGLVTAEAGLAIVALGADCAPVLLADSVAGVVGAAHAGRRGLVVGILPAIVAAMRDLGARDISARVGPAICGRCYEVPADLRDEVGAVAPAAAATTRWGTAGVDIGAGAMSVLRELGVAAVRAGACTYETPTLYSYRRDGITGRHAGAVVVR